MNNNFEHLRKYASLYEIAMEVEFVLLTATSQAKLKMAGNCMRQIIEGMLELVMKKYKCKYTEKLAENLYTARMEQIFSKETLTNLYKIKNVGNICSHAREIVTEKQIREMYYLVQKESFKMVNYYLNDRVVEDYHKQKIRNVKKENVQQVTSQQNVMEMNAQENLSKAEEPKFSLIDLIVEILGSIVGWGFLTALINSIAVGM